MDFVAKMAKSENRSVSYLLYRKSNFDGIEIGL